MAPRRRKKKTGLLREDAARDAMRPYGFEEHLINATIKELLELYTEDGWHLIEDSSYTVLFDAILAKNEKQETMAKEDQDKEPEEEEEPEEDPEEPEEDPEAEDQCVEGGRDQVGSNSVSLVGNGQEMGIQTCQTDAISIINEVVKDSPAFHSGEAFAPHYLAVASSSRGGWLSSEDDESDPEDDADDDDDDEMIQLTPEPLCEELKELVQEVKRQKKGRYKVNSS